MILVKGTHSSAVLLIAGVADFRLLNAFISHINLEFLVSKCLCANVCAIHRVSFSIEKLSTGAQAMLEAFSVQLFGDLGEHWGSQQQMASLGRPDQEGGVGGVAGVAKVVARIAAAALAGTMAAQVCAVLAPAALHTFRFTAAFCHFKNELQQHPLLLKLESAFLQSSHAKPTKRMRRSSSLECC